MPAVSGKGFPETTKATEKSLDEAAKVRYLEPGDFVLSRGEGGTLRLTLSDDRSFVRAKARRCFPFSFATRYTFALRAEELGRLTSKKAV